MKEQYSKEIEYYKHYIAVVDKLVKVLESMKHRKRCDKSIERAFKKACPEYTILVDPKHCNSLFVIRIWGNGIDYKRLIHICVNNDLRDFDTMLDKLISECKGRCNFRDYAERLMLEQSQLEQMIEAEKQLNKLREKLQSKIKTLSNSYKDRCEDVSYFTKERFPLLFDYNPS